MTEGYIYLASPYSHALAEVREQRFQEALRASAWLMNKGEIVFSPIAHSHPIAVNHSLPLGWEFWERMDTVFVARSSGVIVLTIEGWDTSKGVQAEIAIAKQAGLPVRLLFLDSKNGYAFDGEC